MRKTRTIVLACLLLTGIMTVSGCWGGNGGKRIGNCPAKTKLCGKSAKAKSCRAPAALGCAKCGKETCKGNCCGK